VVVAGLLPGRDPYHPNQRQQRHILRNDRHRARVVAGEPAKVSELRQQWRDTTVGENPRDFAQFVTRRAILALERAEYRILGPHYKSPRLVKPEILASTRFREGLKKIPGATVEEAGKMLDELATGWSRVSVDLVSVLGKALSRGFDPEIDYDKYQVAAMRAGLEAHPAVLLFSHRSYIDGAVVPVEVSAAALISMFYDGGYTPKKFGLLAGTYAFPQATLKAAQDVLKQKGADVTVEQFDIGARDFTSQLVSLQRQNVDSVLLLGSFSEAGFAIKQARELGMTNVRWVVDGSAVSTAIIPILGNADGIRGYYNAPAFPGQTPATREFEARLKKHLSSLPQGRPSIYDLIGYGSGYVVAEAIKATSCQLTRGNLIDAWSGLKDAGPTLLGGLDVTFPESYTPTDHQGVYRIGAAIVKDGQWQVYRVIDKP